ncbi:MAG: asparagine synthase (glutamine-hydrolyzing) [Ruminococcus flavefaciens]|nr:asparagine synthase (glutamine-hydrolyzing) [Ruminococcus flavefaciens]
MCGIAGIIKKKGNKPSKEEIRIMNKKMAHRGPDAEGIYINGNVGLGHRRLSIVDLTEDGNQPMLSWDGKYVIVFNGEIYNYLELKEALKSNGANFKNETDTEVILESYRYWGEDCVKYFNGMWSIVLYDITQKKIFISRDRFGVKPLYIYESEEELIFASEIKCITSIRMEKEVDVVQVARYLAGIQEDMDEHTFYLNIRNFPKSYSMSYDLRSNTKQYNKYWEIDIPLFKEKWKCKNVFKLFRNLLEDAIRIRLRADVEVGASLSGGLDSSIIVGVISKQFRTKLHTFSSIYEEKNCDEKEFIDCMNGYADTISHYIYPDNAEDIIQNMKDMLYYHDGPCHSASPYSGFCVYTEAKDNVKVLLDGQGADELFGGYLFFYNAGIKEQLRKNTWISRLKAMNMVFSFLEVWPDQINLIHNELILKVLGVRGYKYFKKKSEKYDISLEKKNKKIKCKERFAKIDLENEIHIDKTIFSELDKELNLQLQYKMLPRILHDVDRNSMANSLEVRLPFLDYRLVEFSYTLPERYKIRGYWTKYIMRMSCKKYLPPKIYSRRNKMGFPAPFDKWLIDERFKDKIKEYLDAFSERNIVDNDSLEQCYQAHMHGDEDCSIQLFRIMMLEMWLQNEIDTREKKWIFNIGE